MKMKQIAVSLLAAGLFGIPGALLAASPSDLLEQGIYSEETKGDLDAALQLYQQAIAQSKADEAIAAQAQYHLGACYYKLRDYTNAAAAFQAVVNNYPGQTNLVANARKYLAGAAAPLQPAPWNDGECMHLEMRLEGGLKIGFAEYSVNAGSTNGEKTWQMHTKLLVSVFHHQSISSVVADATTLRPIASHWKDSILGDVAATYFPDHVDLTNLDNGKGKTLALDGPICDNEEAVEWMRCLPLADGSNTLTVLSSLAYTLVPIGLKISGPEQVQVPAGTFDCYKLQMNIGQTFWYSSDASHYLVKFEAGGAVAELTSVTNVSPDQNVNYTDSTSGISLAAPGGWTFAKEDSDTPGKSVIDIFDPQGTAMSSLTVQPMNLVKTNGNETARTYAQAKITAAAKMYKDFKVRPGSPQDATLAGQPAVSAVCDFVMGQQKTTGYGVWSFGPSNAIYCECLAPSAQFNSFLPQIQAVFNTYQAK